MDLVVNSDQVNLNRIYVLVLFAYDMATAIVEGWATGEEIISNGFTTTNKTMGHAIHVLKHSKLRPLDDLPTEVKRVSGREIILNKAFRVDRKLNS